jgi:hypothetical protein
MLLRVFRLAVLLFVILGTIGIFVPHSAAIPPQQAALKRVALPAQAFEVGQPLPRWDNGYLVAYRQDPARFLLFDSQGALIFDFTPEIPEVVKALVDDVAANKSGSVAAAATLWRKDGTVAHVVLIMERPGRIARIIRTNPHAPRRVAFGPDDTIWTFGVSTEWRSGDYDTVQKYSYSGVLQGSFVPRSTLTLLDGPDPSGHAGSAGGMSGVFAAGERIGIYSATGREWIELDETGRVTGRWKLAAPRSPSSANTPLKMGPIVMDAIGSVYVNAWLGKDQALARLDKAKGEWVLSSYGGPGQPYPSEAGRLLGSVGDKLVFRALSTAELLWYETR